MGIIGNDILGKYKSHWISAMRKNIKENTQKDIEMNKSLSFSTSKYLKF